MADNVIDTPVVPEDGQGEQETTQTVDSLYEGELPDKFKGKSVKETVDMYLNLEKEFGGKQQLEDKIAEQDKYIQAASKVLTVVDQDDELTNKVREKLGYDPITPEDDKKEDVKDPRVDTVLQEVGSIKHDQQTRTIKEFEEQHQFSTLDQSERKGLKEKIGEKLKAWENNPMSLPAERLNALLEDAYALVGGEHRENEMKQRVQAEAYTNQVGTFGRTASIADTAEGANLTSEEVTVAKKLGLSTEDYLQGKKDIAESYKLDK